MSIFRFQKTFNQGLTTLFFSAIVATLPTPIKAATLVNPWEPIFEGIDYATGFTDDPVPQSANSFRIDLLNPEIQFFSTPSNGDIELETIAQTTSQFLEEFDLQVAVNANFFAPCCEADSEPKDLINLAISNGEIVSPSDGLESGNIQEIPDSILITEDNQAEITSTNPDDDFSNIFTAVSAGPRLVVDGEIVIDEVPRDAFYDLNPRTTVGLSEDEQYLYLVTIDGRQPGVSEGATLFQTGEWLVRFGAYQGLNLDGGGSTTMVREDEFGNALVLNIPSTTGGIERFNGNNLGVFSQPLSVPEPSTLGFICFSFIGLALSRSQKNS
ncbi:MAG: phosphodiester glycosidase family protein [Cyanobacteria bacterium J06592_8]